MKIKDRNIIHSEVIRNRKVRYILIDEATGEIVDDAQGYGYKTVRGAYSAYKYKSLSSEERKQREEKMNLVHEWCKKNKPVMRFFSEIACEMAMGKWGPDDRVDEEFVRKTLVEWGYKEEELGFTLKELMKYGWMWK